jgi:micrococcal nuclease
VRRRVALLALASVAVLALSGCSGFVDSLISSLDTPSAEPDAVVNPSGPIPIPANAYPATVNYVHDGDTLFLNTAADPNLKVRLTGIDTPEIGDNLECYGDEATNTLRALLPEGTAVLASPDIEPLDQYGRSLLYLFTTDGTFINQQMIAEGAAEELHYEPNVAYRDQLSAEESLASSSLVGLWGAC